MIDPVVSELRTVRKTHGKNLVFLHVNINSLKDKYDNIDELLVNKYADVLCITETKLNDEYKSPLYECNGFKLYRKDRTSNSGGMVLWIRSDIPQERIQDLEITSPSHHIECIVVKLTVKNEKWYLICVYKNPKVPDNIFITKLAELLNNVTSEAKEIVLIGDINIDMQHKNDNVTSMICNVYGLSNVIKAPTCFKKPEGTLIDPVIVMNAKRFQCPINVHCGYSDFHNMVGCVTKVHVPPQMPVKITYRSYRNYVEEEFKSEVSRIPFHVAEIFDDVSDRYWMTSEMYKDVLDDHAPVKSRKITSQQVPYMHSALRKEMYTRNMLKNRYFQWRTPSLEREYNKQKNKVTEMRRQAIKSYFMSKCTENCSPREFWECIRPYMNDKTKSHRNIILQEDDKIVTSREEVCEIFNVFFSSVADSIGEPDPISSEDGDPLGKLLQKHADHPSVIAIKDMGLDNEFDFRPVGRKYVRQILMKINPHKATGCDQMPGKAMKACSEELTNTVCSLMNKSIQSNTVPDDMKKAEISPVYKKKNDMQKDNYRPVSILTIMAKVYETILAEQLYAYFDTIFFRMLSAYRKKYGCEHVLVKLVDSWKKAMDNDQYVGTVLMDLSKAFDCIPHALLIAKMNAYGLSMNACSLLISYLTGRFQRVKLSDCKSTWQEMKKGVPQGSCLGPLLFNIFINDLFCFMEKCDLVNYADDNTLSCTGPNVEIMLQALRVDTKNALNWFKINFMKANPEKFQVMFLKSFTSPEEFPNYLVLETEVTIERKSHVKLLGVTIDEKLTFDSHVQNICKKASKQVNILYRFKKIFTREEKAAVYRSFVLANFNYCPIVWNFCGQTQIKQMERIQERALRFLLNDFNSNYDQLLEAAGYESLHLRRLKAIACEVFKSLHALNPSYMMDLFKRKYLTYDLRDGNILVQPDFKKVRYGRNTFSYYGAHIWNLLPNHLKEEANDVQTFKRIIGSWQGPNCNCSMCSFVYY